MKLTLFNRTPMHHDVYFLPSGAPAAVCFSVAAGKGLAIDREFSAAEIEDLRRQHAHSLRHVSESGVDRSAFLRTLDRVAESGLTAAQFGVCGVGGSFGLFYETT
jgi:hypothetical protein